MSNKAKRRKKAQAKAQRRKDQSNRRRAKHRGVEYERARYLTAMNVISQWVEGKDADRVEELTEEILRLRNPDKFLSRVEEAFRLMGKPTRRERLEVDIKISHPLTRTAGIAGYK